MNDTVVLDGARSQRNCYVDTQAVAGQLNFINGYTGILDFENPYTGSAADCTLKVANGANLTNVKNQVFGSCNIQFNDNSNVIELDSGTSTIYNLILNSGVGLGQIVVGTQARLLVQTPTGGSAYCNTSIRVNGQMQLQNAGYFDMVLGALTISPDARLNIVDMQTVVLNGSSVLTNNGTIRYFGMPNTTTQVNMAILNNGEVTLSGGGTFQINTTYAVNGSSFCMEDGNLQLAGGIPLDASRNGYLQTAGVLSVMDNATSKIIGGTNGSTIDGGAVSFLSATGFGRLQFDGNLSWVSGTYYCRINGQMGGVGNSDRIVVSNGSLEINPFFGATLDVMVQGQLAGGRTWTIMSAPGEFNEVPFPDIMAPPTLEQTVDVNGLYLES